MKITFISLFPDYYKGFKEHSIIKNAINKNAVVIEEVNPRDFAENNQVDDKMYGGGSGMLMMIEPIVKAINSVKQTDSHIVLMGPRGKTYNQEKAKDLSKLNHIIFVCGHYEGIDARIKHYIDEEISIGNFIITGGEMSSMVVADAIIRLLPGVIKEESYTNESFSEENILEHDQFTKPLTYDGHTVPEVLVSGNHKNINKWKRQNSIDKTIEVELKKG